MPARRLAGQGLLVLAGWVLGTVIMFLILALLLDSDPPPTLPLPPPPSSPVRYALHGTKYTLPGVILA